MNIFISKAYHRNRVIICLCIRMKLLFHNSMVLYGRGQLTLTALGTADRAHASATRVNLGL